MVVFTVLWWNKTDDSSGNIHKWQLVYAKIAPLVQFFLFVLFNIWIRCTSKKISRDIIHPWVSCRCYLYTFIFVLPLIITTSEAIGIWLYCKYFSENVLYHGFYAMMAIAVLLSSWFQFTIIKWGFFVRKYIVIRERRVRQLIVRMEQEDE